MEAIEKATLLALAEECNFSTHAHVAEEIILRNFKTHLRGDARKALKALIKMGYAQKHPTGGSMTYNMTRAGLTESQR